MRLLRLLALLLPFSALIASPTQNPVGTRLLVEAPPPATPEVLAHAGGSWIALAGAQGWSRPSGANTWSPLELPAGFQASPGAAGAADGRDWILVGGENSTAVFRLSLSGGRLAVTPLPSLPAPRAHAGVALLGRVLHVIGGLDGEGRASDRVFALDLAAANPVWTEAPPHPGGALSHPGAAVNFNEILVVGGRSADGAPLSAAWSYRLRPVDGFTTTGWIARTPAPAPMANPAVVPSSTAHFLVFSGEADSRPLHVFQAVLDAWYSPEIAPTPATPLLAVGSGSSARLLARDGSAELGVEVVRSRYNLAALDYVMIGLYFVAMVAVGLLLSGKHDTAAQFSLGNRDVKWWAAGISMFATGASSISFMAIPAMAFATNLVWFFPGFMMIAGFFISAYLIYPLLRRLEITSTYEYLARRFNRGLRLIASAQAIIFQTFGRMSVIMVLPSLAIAAFTGIDVVVAVLLMGVLTTVYTAIGGFKAVIWTDVFQGVLMIVAPLLVIGYSIAGTPGGFSGSLEAAQAYQKLNLIIASWDLALPVFWILILGTLFTILGGVGDQPVIQRVYSVPLKEVRRTALMFTSCGIIISILTYGMGVFMFGFFRGDPSRLAPSIGNDQIVPLFVVQNLPAGICGLVIASIFAAAMSTLSSSMNSVATLVAEDFFPKASDRTRLLIMKSVSYGVGVVGTAVAIYMAKQEVTSMFAIWNKVIALLGGGFVGIYILGVFTTRANSFGAIVGGVASIAMTIWIDRTGAVHWMGYSVVAISTCVIVGYVVSLLTGGSTRDLAGLTAFTARSAPRGPASAVSPAPAASASVAR